MGEAQEASGAAIFLHNTWTGRVKDDPRGTRHFLVPDAKSGSRKKSGYNDPTLMMIVKDEAGQTV
jgi:hypothetical protein